MEHVRWGKGKGISETSIEVTQRLYTVGANTMMIGNTHILGMGIGYRPMRVAPDPYRLTTTISGPHVVSGT